MEPGSGVGCELCPYDAGCRGPRRAAQPREAHAHGAAQRLVLQEDFARRVQSLRPVSRILYQGLLYQDLPGAEFLGCRLFGDEKIMPLK